MLLVICVPALSQDRHLTRIFYPDSDAGEIARRTQTNSLGEVLLSGYLDGKLKGYRFAVGDSVTKWIMPDELPPEWDSSQEYFSGELVTFAGNVYVAIDEYSSKSPADTTAWRLADIRMPLSRVRFFPAEKDTLSKFEFLDTKMLVSQPFLPEPWSHDREYYTDEMVTYDKRVYRVLQDVPAYNPSPEVDSENWQEIILGLDFISWSECHDVTVLFNYSVSGSDTTWIPEMVTVCAEDPLHGMPRSLCHFYYRDVMEYLNKIPSPVPTVFPYGYLNNSLFEFSFSARGELIDALRGSIQRKVTKVSKKNIINADLYTAWLADATSAIEWDSPWSILQDLTTREVRLSRMDFDAFGFRTFTPFLVISPKQVEDLLKTEQRSIPAITSYALLLSDWNNFVSDSLAVFSPPSDSLTPLPASPIPSNAGKTAYSFFEEYRLYLNSPGTDHVASAIAKAWTEIEKAYFSGTIKDVNRDKYRSFFSDNHRWGKLTLLEQYPLDENFSLSRDRGEGVYELSLPDKLVGIAVVYEKSFSRDKAVDPDYFVPLVVGIDYATEEDLQRGIHRSISFEWNDWKKILLLANDPELNTLVEAIEDGALNFAESALLYGLKEK